MLAAQAVYRHGVLIVAVVGPTATGKSDLALDLACALGGSVRGAPPAEIVNADAFQLYAGMDIGTAKVPLTERRGLVHHQLDVLDVSEDASVAEYQHQARADLDAIADRGGRPVVVGGSGLYLRALLDDMTFPGTDPAVRAALEQRAEAAGTRALYDELVARDPAAAAAIQPRNTRRVVRALEVIELTGLPYTANLPRQEYVRPTVQIGLDVSRDVLDDKVARRVDRMVEAGLVAEVRALAERLGRTAARAVGYAEVLRALAGETTLDQAYADIVVHTRRLARKQMGWFGRDPRVHWLQASSPTLVEDALAIVAAADAGDLESSDVGPARRPLGSATSSGPVAHAADSGPRRLGV